MWQMFLRRAIDAISQDFAFDWGKELCHNRPDRASPRTGGLIDARLSRQPSAMSVLISAWLMGLVIGPE